MIPMLKPLIMNTKLSDGGLVAVSFVGGFLAAVLLLAVSGFVLLRSSDAYGLGHWKLNVKMPLSKMWMNLGYWKNEKGDAVSDFEEACSNLLKEILRAARLLSNQREGTSDSKDRKNSHSLAILDLGFGCGDQILELVRLTAPPQGWTADTFRYVGLTLNESQISTASRRLSLELTKPVSQNASPSDAPTVAASPSSPLADPRLSMDSFRLFRDDAAKPDSWNIQTRQAVQSITEEPLPYKEKWLLALDCLYHFSPSRVPIFQYVSTKLEANIMAFDLLLNPAASFKDKLYLKAVAFMMNCPLNTFLTEEEYRQQLKACGYASEQVELKDVTDCVFAGVSDFIERQEHALNAYGVSLGGFKLAGRLFKWFGKAGVVRAVIVVARKSKI